jgi:hypothetical protein
MQGMLKLTQIVLSGNSLPLPRICRDIRRFNEPLGFGNEHLAGWLGVQVRRHDLHTGLVESVLNLRVQVGQDQDPLPRFIEIHDELVLDIEVGERPLDEARVRLFPHAGRPLSGQQEHRVDLSPRHIVADRHCR